MGEYRFYLGVGSPDAIDWTTPVGTAPAGTGQVELDAVLTPWVEYYYGVRAVSDAAVEEENIDRIVRVMVDDNYDLLGPPPNAIAWADVEAAAAGKIRLRVYYSARSEVGEAAAIQVALITGGVADWDNPIQQIAIAGTKRLDVVLDDTFSDGETIRLAIRAVTASGTGGEAYVLDAVTADSTAPGAIGYVEAEQYS